MGRRRITATTASGINPAAANVPSVIAAANGGPSTAGGGPGVMVTATPGGPPAQTPGQPPPRGTKRATSAGNGNLTNHQRKIICEFYQRSGGVMSQKDLAQWTKHEFGLKKAPAQSTMSGILRRQHEFINMSSLELGIKKRRVVQHPQLDNALANWVIQCAHRGITVQGDMTKEKAKHFAKMLQIPEEEQPEFSNGWLHSFQLRHNFSFRKFNGEAPSTQGGQITALGTTPETKRMFKFTTLDALIEETKKFELKDVFCMAEMGVLYNLPPSTADDAVEADAQRTKKRFVGAFACNADGSEKLQPLFISHHEKPKCFRQKTAEQHGMQYFWNSKAWMTGVIFSKWLQRLDFAMTSQRRKVMLIINEAPSHAVAHLELLNVVVYFVPEGMTTLNPMTTGMLSTLKLRYRRHYLRHVIDKSDGGKNVVFSTNVLAAMKWACTSWDELSAETIERSWSMTQVLGDRLPMRPDLQVNQEAATLEAEVAHLLLLLRLKDTMSLVEFLNDDAKFDNSIHEEFFEVVQAADEVPDDEVDDEGDDTSPTNLTLQDKLKAFRDVLHVLKDRTDTDDTAVSVIRRVQDAIRNEARQETYLTPADLQASLQPTTTSTTNDAPSALADSAAPTLNTHLANVAMGMNTMNTTSTADVLQFAHSAVSLMGQPGQTVMAGTNGVVGVRLAGNNTSAGNPLGMVPNPADVNRLASDADFHAII